MNIAKQRYWAVVAAGGSGSRMGPGQPKQYRILAGKTVLEHCVSQLLGVERLAGVFVGADRELAQPIIARIQQPSPSVILRRCEPAATRAGTVLAALEMVQQYAEIADWVLVHDAARPLVRIEDVDRLIDSIGDADDGGLLGWPVTDSLGLSENADGRPQMTRSVSRDGLWRAATPQMFRLGSLYATLQASIDNDTHATDEAGMMSAAGFHPTFVACSPTNFKITRIEDLQLASKLIDATTTSVRVGTGFDVHRLVAGRPLILGGVKIPFERGLAGHSDADVLLHAIIDACLGAAALGDIGGHFPDSDSQYQGVDSRELLRLSVARVAEAGFSVANVDATIIAEAPRLSPYVAAMTTQIASDCGVDVDCVNVKATTTEGLGFTGRGEGIASQASVILHSRS